MSDSSGEPLVYKHITYVPVTMVRNDARTTSRHPSVEIIVDLSGLACGDAPPDYSDAVESRPIDIHIRILPPNVTPKETV